MNGKGYQRRMGRSEAGVPAEAALDVPAPEAKESKPSEKAEGGAAHAEQREKRSWMAIVRSGAQLTLDVIRVVREATDLYRHLRYRD